MIQGKTKVLGAGAESIFPITITKNILFNGTSKTLEQWIEEHGEVGDLAAERQLPNRGIVYDTDSVFCLSGASFGNAGGNGWFELACSKLGVTPMNKAVSGSHVNNLASGMFDGTFWTSAEFESMTHLVIMFTHNYDVFAPQVIEDNWLDYTNNFQYTGTQSARCFDYIIHKYRAMCYDQRNVAGSKWYGTEHGKPCNIILCTHWHDARTLYNSSIRQLSRKWNIPLICFDENAGYTYLQPLESSTGDSVQYSLLLSNDSEVINGITVGWHPKGGQTQVPQKQMAKTFCDYMAPNAKI